MCLNVLKVKHSYKYETIDGQKLIPVWKVVTNLHESPSSAIGAATGAKYHAWNQGWNQSSVRGVKQEQEMNFVISLLNQVYLGFHLLITKKDAVAYMNAMIQHYKKTVTIRPKDLTHRLKVIKVYVKKEDVVGKGTSSFGNFFGCPSLVATKAYWKGI